MLDRGLCLIGSVQGVARCNHWQRKYGLLLIESHDELTLVFKLYKKHTIADVSFGSDLSALARFHSVTQNSKGYYVLGIYGKRYSNFVTYICYRIFSRDILITINFFGVVDH